MRSISRIRIAPHTASHKEIFSRLLSCRTQIIVGTKRIQMTIIHTPEVIYQSPHQVDVAIQFVAQCHHRERWTIAVFFQQLFTLVQQALIQ